MEYVTLEEVTSINCSPETIVITTIELEKALLNSLTNRDMSKIKLMTANASILLWVTGGALFKAQNPEQALILGLSRTLMLERPSLKMPVLDLDDITNHIEPSIANVLLVLDQTMHSSKPDFEYRQHEGQLYCSRFIPDVPLNDQFRLSQNEEATLESLDKAGSCQLNIVNVGRLDSIVFKQLPPPKPKLEPGTVEIRVKAVGLNGKVSFSGAGLKEIC